MFNQFLKVIPSEPVQEYIKGEKKPLIVDQPLPRSIEIVETALRCLCILAHESDTKEPMSYSVVQPTIFAMDLCAQEATIVQLGMQLFYNLCYRCESAQEVILVYLKPIPFFKIVRHHHDGDPDVMVSLRKLELTLMENGWRGNAEKNISREMMGLEIEPEYLIPIDMKKNKK